MTSNQHRKLNTEPIHQLHIVPLSFIESKTHFQKPPPTVGHFSPLPYTKTHVYLWRSEDVIISRLKKIGAENQRINFSDSRTSPKKLYKRGRSESSRKDKTGQARKHIRQTEILDLYTQNIKKIHIYTNGFTSGLWKPITVGR